MPPFTPRKPPPGTAGVPPASDRAAGTGVAVNESAGGTPALPGHSRVGKPRKCRETIPAIARRTPGIDRRCRIGVTERHAAEQHVFVREVETRGYGLVPVSPRLDAAGVQALAAGKQHDGLHEHAEVRPLRRPHGAVDGKEQPDRTMGAPQWSDLGMFVQTVMLLARGEDRKSTRLNSSH